MPRHEVQSPSRLPTGQDDRIRGIARQARVTVQNQSGKFLGL